MRKIQFPEKFLFPCVRPSIHLILPPLDSPQVTECITDENTCRIKNSRIWGLLRSKNIYIAPVWNQDSHTSSFPLLEGEETLSRTQGGGGGCILPSLPFFISHPGTFQNNVTIQNNKLGTLLNIKKSFAKLERNYSITATQKSFLSNKICRFSVSQHDF